MRSRRAVLLVALLVVAAWLRLQGLDWDQGQHLHPDERFLTMVANDTRWPDSAAGYFDTARSPLNPANAGHGFFVYGTLPLFLVKAVGGAVGASDYARVHLVGRVVSALFDLGTILLTWRLALLLAGPRAAWAAALLVAFSAISIQQAHFFTVDSAAAFFSTASVFMLLKAAGGGGVRWHVWFGVAFGLALACRVNLILLGPLYPVALWYAWRRHQVDPRRLLAAGALAGLAAIALFRILQPYAFAGPGVFDLALASGFLDSLATIRDYTTGIAHYPPGVQWIGRLPIVFPARNLLVWGLGPAWGLAAIAGLFWCFLRRQPAAADEPVGAGRVALLWAPLLFLFHASQFAPTGRYFLPIVPLLAVAPAWMLGGHGAGPGRRRLLIGVVVLTGVWALAFTSIYRRPHTRVDASRWIYAHVDPGDTIAVEHWDDGLPLAVDGRTPAVYDRFELTLYDEEDDAKRRQLIAALDAADVLVLSSNRLYGSIPRAPWRYPLGRRYYELLFAGELGFRLEQVFTSYPRIGSIELVDDAAEEAFTVYDHPKVLVFRKAKDFSADRVASLLQAVALADIVHVAPRDASDLYRRARPPDIRLAGEAEARSPVAAGESGSVDALFRWLLTFELVSLAWFAILFRPLAAARDRGYGLGKLLAWLGCGTVTWLVASAGLASNTAGTARIIGGALLLAGALAAWRQRSALAGFWRTDRRVVLWIETVWLAAFGLFLGVRALNPAIYWGEKPMDFAILNACLRSLTMPPADPWFAGAPLNYFYVGHALTAVFTSLAGVPPAYAFNLAVATIAGMLATAAFLLAFQLSGRIAAGSLAACAVVIVGNLAGLRMLLAGSLPALTFDYFWATSRVVAGTINEFPFWNLVFADLHAHVLAMPFEVALVYLGSLWMARSAAAAPVARLLLAGLIAWVLGTVAVTSSWSLPTVVAVQLGLLATAWLGGDRTVRGLVRAAGMWMAIVVAGLLIYWPFWSRYEPPARLWGWVTNEFAPIADVLTIFGVFLVMTLPALAGVVAGWARARPRRVTVAVGAVVIAAAVGSLRSPACGLFAAWATLAVAAWLMARSPMVRTGALLVALAGSLGVTTECVFVWDRMNTVFKYYLQMWLLLGCGGGLLAWSALDQASARARRLAGVAVAGAVAAGVFTSVTGLAGFLRTPLAPGTGTLDGMAYLAETRPAERAAYRWLNREVTGIPVMLEAQGPPYQEFSRVAMNTGLPTVLGWEYHLVQQGRSRAEIAVRASDVREIYETTDPATAERLLRKYHVDLVVVGPLEQQTYGPAGLAKFDDLPILEPVFREGSVTIYATPGRVHSVKTWIDRVPVGGTAPIAVPALAPLREPRGIAVAPDGTIVVADFGNRRVQRLDAALEPIGAFGREGGGSGEFRDPGDVAVAGDGSVWVADTWNHRIQHLTATGEPLAAWQAGLYGPRGIALSSEGVVHVADTGNHRILRFTPGGEPTVVVAAGRLDHPVGIAVGRSGDIYVADVGHRRIAVFSSDGRLIREWPVEGWGSDGLMEPHLAIGPDDVVWVTDPAGKRVLLFDGDGNRLGAAVPQVPLGLPLGIAVIDRDTAVVTDAASGRVVRVRREGAPAS